MFSNLGKAGGCDSAQLEAISRLISLALRSGIATGQVVEQLRGITCCPAWDDGTLVRSGPDAVALALERRLNADPEGRPIAAADALQLSFIADPQLANGSGNSNGGSSYQARKCPDCNGTLHYLEGCVMCVSCGWNKCE